jgi:beta-barrel assembly-enhancing protease
MNRIGMVPLIIFIAGIFTVLFAQTATVNDLLNKKNLKTVEQNLGKKAEQATTTAKTSVATLIKTDTGIPLIGDMPDSSEQALGRETAGRMLSAYPLLKNDSLQKYVNLVGSFVAQQSNRPGLKWTFGVIESDDINAFAMPGGYIVLTSGLYKTLTNEAELAGVLGHEIAHVNLRHHVHLMQKQLLIAKGSNYLSGKTSADAVKELVGTGAQITARSLDKEAEFESDRTGIVYTARAGYDPFAYLELLDRIGANNATDRLSLLFKTHPHPRDRIDALEKAMGTRWNGVKGVVPARWVRLE